MNSPRRAATKSGPGGAARAGGGGKSPELVTLGGVRLARGGVDETAKLGPKHLALLIYLFHERRPMQPSEVTELLGRGRDDEKEMEGLHRAVSWLRENVPGIDIRLSAETVEAFGGVTIDTREVDAAIDGGDARHVAELYVGEFLEGFQSGAPAFDEWANKERGRLKRAWNHAMLSAAREAERRRNWEVAADWWSVLVARAPMRPEAVAGLLGALADSGQAEQAARAYAEYLQRLKESRIAQPAEPVKEVIAKYKVLRDVADGKIKPPPGSPTPRASTPRRAPPPPPPPQVPDLDFEPTALAEPEPPATKTPPAPERPAAGKPVAGFQAGTAPPMREAVPDRTPAKPGATEEAWDQIVDMAAADDFDVPVTPKPPPPKPGAGAAVTDRARPEPSPRAKKLKDDEGLQKAREALKSYKETGHHHGVRHEVTSVRKPWGPKMQQWWKDLEPLRTALVEAAIAAAKAVAAVTVILAKAAARGLKLAGRRGAAAAQVGAEKARARSERRAQARARKAEEKAARSAEKEATKSAKAAEKQRARAAKQKAKRAPKEPPKRPKAADAAPPEPQALPWEDEPAPAPSPKPTPPAKPAPAPAAPWDEPPVFAEPPVAESPAVGFAAPAAEVPLVEVAPPRKKRARRRMPAIGPVVRRFWWAPLGLAAVGLAVVYGPRAIGMVGGFTESLPSRLPDVQAPSLPRVSLPRVTIRTPSFVETGVSRIASMFSGPLLEEPGQWLLVADASVEGADGESAVATRDGVTADVLGLLLETDLRQARFFYVMPRERARLAVRRELGTTTRTVPLDRALALASAGDYAAVIAGRVTLHQGVDSVRLHVYNASGDTLYGVASEVSQESSTTETLVGLTRAVRRRLGEPGDEINSSLAPTQMLSTSASALAAYVEARDHYFAGRYQNAIVAARTATRRDSTFALAHRTLAEALAQSGQRGRARNALEVAWRFADRLGERERLRLLADRHAWDGRLSEAALTYDDVFASYRDDVGALRSQALVQRMIGVRGGGEGNLRVAYSVDPYDWPSLQRIARYIGYRGALPSVDSLVASLQE